MTVDVINSVGLWIYLIAPIVLFILLAWWSRDD